jgi:hypothetical protein
LLISKTGAEIPSCDFAFALRGVNGTDKNLHVLAITFAKKNSNHCSEKQL